MRASAILVVAAALTGLPAAAAGQPWVTVDSGALTAESRDLAALRAEHVAALNAGDAERLRALYAPDAIALLGDGVLRRGADDIGRYVQESLTARADGVSLALSPRHFRVDANVASETGIFSEAREGETPAAASGIYVTVYTRDGDGHWRIAMELRTRGRDPQIARW